MWNYRVVKTRYRSKNWKKDDVYEDVFIIREVYYDEEGEIVLYSSDDRGIAPLGLTKDELMQDLQKMVEALDKPVLTPKDLPNYTYSTERGEIQDEEDQTHEKGVNTET